jgi:hypothetical protein
MNRRLMKEIIIGTALGAVLAWVAFFYVKNNDVLEMNGFVMDLDGALSPDSSIVYELAVRNGSVWSGNTNLIDMNLTEMGEKLCDEWHAGGVNLRRRPDLKLRIDVDPEEPLFWIKADRLYALSRFGRVLAPEAVDPCADLPVFLTGDVMKLDTGEHVQECGARYAAYFLGGLKDNENDIFNLISTIRIDGESGVVITLIPDEVPVAMGYSDFDYKIMKLKSIIDFLNENPRRFSMVDLRSGDIILFKTETGRGRIG